MQYHEFLNNWQTLSEMIHQPVNLADDQLATLKKRYIEQNISILNDLFVSSIDNLKRLQQVKSPNDIICAQARLTSDMNKKLALSAQRFLNASLGHIADYNEWLKAHCDLSTD